MSEDKKKRTYNPSLITDDNDSDWYRINSSNLIQWINGVPDDADTSAPTSIDVGGDGHTNRKKCFNCEEGHFR